MKDSMRIYKGRYLCVSIFFLSIVLTTTTLAWRIPTQDPPIQDEGLTVDQIFKRGLALQLEGDDDGAEIWYQLALWKDSTHWLSLDNLGLIYYRKWKFREAENCWVRSRQSKSCNAVSTSNLAGLYTEVGLYSQAIPLWRDLERIGPATAKRHQTKTRIHECQQELERGGPRIDGGWYELMGDKVMMGQTTRAQVKDFLGAPDSESKRSAHYEGKRFKNKGLFYRNIGFAFDDRGVVVTIILSPEANVSPKGVHYLFTGKTFVAKKPGEDDRFPFTEIWSIKKEVKVEVTYFRSRDGGVSVAVFAYAKKTMPGTNENEGTNEI